MLTGALDLAVLKELEECLDRPTGCRILLSESAGRHSFGSPSGGTGQRRIT